MKVPAPQRSKEKLISEATSLKVLVNDNENLNPTCIFFFIVFLIKKMLIKSDQMAQEQIPL